ncbi:MAG: hypothetical protein PHQ03_06520 [Methylococcales bacterium]|nr:hypothetical protein [Methylococcales bacterium]
MLALPIELEQQITSIAAAEKIPVTVWLTNLIEDYQDARILEKAWREFEASGMKTLSLDEFNHEMAN